MSENTVFIGDIGTEIVLDCGTNIADLTACSMIARKSNGEIVTWPAALKGTRSIRYVIEDGDIDVPGRWSIQAHVTTPDGEWYGSISTFNASVAL